MAYSRKESVGLRLIVPPMPDVYFASGNIAIKDQCIRVIIVGMSMQTAASIAVFGNLSFNEE